jgi:hypothetical protein
VGHTEFQPVLPKTSDEEAKLQLESLLCAWNVWTRWCQRPKPSVPFDITSAKIDRKSYWECPFFQVLSDEVSRARNLYSDGPPPEGLANEDFGFTEGIVRFFAQTIVIMHPYTESILSDMLGKMMFWGERGAEAVTAADASCRDWLEVREDLRKLESEYAKTNENK